MSTHAQLPSTRRPALTKAGDIVWAMRTPAAAPTTAVACTPRKRLGKPAMASAAMRPWRLAGPASGTCVGSPETKSTISTASPAAMRSSIACCTGAASAQRQVMRSRCHNLDSAPR